MKKYNLSKIISSVCLSLIIISSSNVALAYDKGNNQLHKTSTIDVNNIQNQVVCESEKYYRLIEDEDSNNSKMEEISKAQAEEEMKIYDLKQKNHRQKRDITSSKTTASWMKLNIRVRAIGNKQYKIQGGFKWLKDPYYRKKDVIYISANKGLTFLPNTERFSYSYIENSSLRKNYKVTKSSCDIDPDTNGSAAIFQLGESIKKYNFDTINHEGTFSVTAKVSPSYFKGGISMYVGYLHGENTVSISPSLTHPFGVGVSVSNSNSYDKANPVGAYMEIK